MLVFNYSYSYFVKSELYKVEFIDRFNLIKNPMSIFYGKNHLNDIDQYCLKLLKNYKRKIGYATNNLPLRDLLFKSSINNQLFEQYYLQVQNYSDYHLPRDLNYKRLFIINYYETKIFSKESSHFEFQPLFYIKNLVIENQDNYPKLILNCLNLLSMWFNANIGFSLNNYFLKILKFFVFIFKCLSKLKKLLYPYRYL